MVYILHDFCTSFFAGGPLFAFDAAAQILEMRSHSHVPRLGLKYAKHDGGFTFKRTWPEHNLIILQSVSWILQSVVGLVYILRHDICRENDEKHPNIPCLSIYM